MTLGDSCPHERYHHGALIFLYAGQERARTSDTAGCTACTFQRPGTQCSAMLGSETSFWSPVVCSSSLTLAPLIFRRHPHHSRSGLPSPLSALPLPRCSALSTGPVPRSPAAGSWPYLGFTRNKTFNLALQPLHGQCCSNTLILKSPDPTPREQ